MVRVASLFSQLLGEFSRSDFERAVSQHQAERYAKRFSCWDQFVAMLFCQLAQAKSLREITGGLASCEGKLRHLGLKRAPSRSTLAYANEHRSWELYETVFRQLLSRCQATVRGPRKFRFKNKLYSLDSTVIDLSLSMFDWAKYVQTKGAVKLHLLLDHDGHLPVFAHITDARIHDVELAQKLVFPAESVLVLDRGYLDYGLYEEWTDNRVWFVTRERSNAVYEVIEEHDDCPERGIIADQTIELTGTAGLRRCTHPLRRVVYRDPRTDQQMVFLTNQMRFSATTIASIYKERWQIELFFKALKQNLRIKTFVGVSPNAVRVQIWTALIAVLLLKYMQLRAKHGWSLSNLVMLLRLNLFTYRDLWRWLDDPEATPPIDPSDQLPLPLQ